MSKQINNLLSRLDKVKTLPNGKWQALCPAHNDKTPSLAIKETDDGKILLKCWAGCDVQSILSSIGLTFEDMFPERIKTNYHRRPSKKPSFSKSELFDLMMQESTLLLICINSLTGNPLNNPNFYKPDFNLLDLMRVVRAFETIMAIREEVRNGQHY